MLLGVSSGCRYGGIDGPCVRRADTVYSYLIVQNPGQRPDTVIVFQCRGPVRQP